MSQDNKQETDPESGLQLFREIVTAVIGISIIIVTIILIVITFTFIGDATKFSAAKDLLLLVFSLTGVVMGYYFGRVPAEGRAAEAQKQTYQANSKVDKVTNK